MSTPFLPSSVCRFADQPVSSGSSFFAIQMALFQPRYLNSAPNSRDFASVNPAALKRTYPHQRVGLSKTSQKPIARNFS